MQYSNWRNWPMQILYLPATVYAIAIGIRNGNIFFLSLANPEHALGGFVLDSKYEQQQHIPAPWRLKSLRIKPNEGIKSEQIHALFDFPVIVKPDVGEGGKGVKHIMQNDTLIAYTKKAKVAFIIQEYTRFPHEYSILCYRFTSTVFIRSITERIPLEVTGDGKMTLRDLINRLPYSNNKRKRIIESSASELNETLANKELRLVNGLGNYDFGATYVEHTEVHSPLKKAITELFTALQNYNVARIDVKANDWNGLQNGCFKVLEINGLNGEPIHIYDQKYTLLAAQKEILKHWKQVYNISKNNAKSFRNRTSLWDGIKLLNKHLTLTQYAKN